MPDNAFEIQRRTLLQLVAGLAVGRLALEGVSVTVAADIPPAGDFGFLAGSWKIKHRQLTDKGWDEFEGEATVWSALNGGASIEELRIPARNFSGMGIRVFDVEQRVWADHWVNGRVGVVNPPMFGSFDNGVATFIADDTDGDQPIKSRGIWDRITPTSCRWYQSVSRDDGKTWEDNWYMEWTRV